MKKTKELKNLQKLNNHYKKVGKRINKTRKFLEKQLRNGKY